MPPPSHTPVVEFFLIALVSVSYPSNPSYTHMKLDLPFLPHATRSPCTTLVMPFVIFIMGHRIIN